MNEILNLFPTHLVWLGLAFGFFWIVQFTYLIGPSLALALKSGQKITQKSTEAVSVVVCAHNELGNLPKLLDALLAQTHPDFEIIIVDDRSNDSSYEYLLKMRDDHQKIRHVRVNENPDWMNPKKYALTLGIKAAKNDIVLLTDADCLPAKKSWITEMAAHFTPNKRIVIGYAPYKKTKGVLNLFIRFEAFYAAVQYLGLALVGVPYMGVGRNMAYRKSVFFEQKGFLKHAKIMGGDDDLLINAIARKANTAVALSPGAQSVSVPKTSVKQWYVQKKRHLSVSRFYKTKHKLILGLWAASHTGFWLTTIGLALFFNAFGQTWLLILGGAVLLRWVLIGVFWGMAVKKLNEKINPMLFPLLDLAFVLYYPFFTIPAMLARKIKWQ